MCRNAASSSPSWSPFPHVHGTTSVIRAVVCEIARRARAPSRFECRLRSAPGPTSSARASSCVSVSSRGASGRRSIRRGWPVREPGRSVPRSDRSPRPASARLWPGKTCSWSGFASCPTRAGTLEIPAVQAELKGRSGRSQPKSVSIQAVPLPGRPAEFLGGVGRFELHAEASPKVVRVGQELDFRIKVTGPAAWGMTDRPDLGRYGRLGLGLRIEPKPDETIDEPPARTFVYRLRPTQAGEAVLPPVAIAAFDPSLSHYVTHVTAGVPIRVVAVPSFDPTTINYEPPSTAMSRPAHARLGLSRRWRSCIVGGLSSCSETDARRRVSDPSCLLVGPRARRERSCQDRRLEIW